MSNFPVTCKITGLKEIQEYLERIPKRDANKALRDALKAGGEPVRLAMVKEAPKDSGFLSEHFDIKIKIKGGDIIGFANIGPMGKVDYPFGANHPGARLKRNTKTGRATGRISVLSVARFFEFGTKHLRANPFMTRAWMHARSAALDNIIQSLRTYVQMRK